MLQHSDGVLFKSRPLPGARRHAASASWLRADGNRSSGSQRCRRPNHPHPICSIIGPLRLRRTAPVTPMEGAGRQCPGTPQRAGDAAALTVTACSSVRPCCSFVAALCCQFSGRCFSGLAVLFFFRWRLGSSLAASIRTSGTLLSRCSSL